jgi:co-chaperonin GroES (HSP10)
MVSSNRIKKYLQEDLMKDAIVKPEQDFMLVKKHEKKSFIHLPKEAANSPREMIPFEILSIGPGHWEFGVYIKTTHKVGDMVLINGPIIATKYNDEEYLFAKERDIAGTLI